jgi:predicted DCC family thiol-disulfide oxidoreductase YuxK
MTELESKIILFDGVCNLCNGFVDFVIRRDTRGSFKFASLQSPRATSILAPYGHATPNQESIFLIEGKNAYRRSAAALRIFRGLRGFWPFLYVFIIVPPFIRDGVYDWVAQNRYRWFGKRDTCRMPTALERERFLE